MAVGADNTVTVATIAADITHLFKNADIKFNGTGFPAGGAQRAQQGAGSRARRAEPGERAARQSGESWDNLWNDVTGAISGEWDRVVGDVESAFSSIDNFMADAEMVAAVVGRLLQFHRDYSHSGTVWSKSVQVGPTPVSPSLQAITAQYSWDLQPTFSLQITDYSLQQIKVTASGDANAAVNADGALLTLNDVGMLGPYTVVPQETFVTFTIPCGPVPIPVTVSGSVTIKLHWTLQGSVSVDANIQASGNVQAGFEYTSGAGFSPFHWASFNGDADMNYVTATATATGTVTVNTQLLVEAMYGVSMQAQVAVAPVVSVTVSETVEGPGVFSVSDSGSGLVATRIDPQNPPYNCPCHPTTTNDAVDTASVAASVGAGVTMSAAAVIDIQHFDIDHTYDLCQGSPCYQHLWNPIDSWCIHEPL